MHAREAICRHSTSFSDTRILILFAWVLGEQLGVPVPSVPLLITVGTLIATHRMSGPASLLCVLVAAILGDSFWYALGKRYGSRVLQLLCRLSFESNTCVAKTEGYFEKRGPSTLLFAKFVPGLNTVAPPIAGELGMPFGGSWSMTPRGFCCGPRLRWPADTSLAISCAGTACC